jgi:hypothetical protein
MRLEFNISGTFTVPDGSRFVDGSENMIRLPDGKVISVHPIFEMASSEAADDHADLGTAEATKIGVEMEDYDRWTDKVEA